MTGRTARRRMLLVQAGDGAAAGPGTGPRADLLAVEEPLETRLNGSPLTVTMRTPRDDIGTGLWLFYLMYADILDAVLGYKLWI